jgi:RecA-family ATPase
MQSFDDLRELQFKKNQYGPKAESIVLRYQNGLLLPVPGMGSLEKIAKDQKDDEDFLTMLDQFEQQGRLVSDKPTAPNYAPAMFSKVNGTSKARFVDAMNRLFVAKQIHVATYGRPSRPYSKIARGAKA